MLEGYRTRALERQTHSFRSMGRVGRSRPLVTFDMDGVLSRNPWGINPGGVRSDATSPAPAPSSAGSPCAANRCPGPSKASTPSPSASSAPSSPPAAKAPASLPKTGSPPTSAAPPPPPPACPAPPSGVPPPARLRSSWRERSSAFKARVIPPLKPLAHFEDDPNTALLLAGRIPHVFLVDWPRNRGIESDNIHRIERISDAIPILERVAGELGLDESGA